ncbi:hypothetical protein DXV76_05535 [Rhodobacteraceae bacterium CCMM004]|nr:hypothetical protein DXV76_05535 [Rhodobacteraceae bacterium CCMM004]
MTEHGPLDHLYACLAGPTLPQMLKGAILAVLFAFVIQFAFVGGSLLHEPGGVWGVLAFAVALIAVFALVAFGLIGIALSQEDGTCRPHSLFSLWGYGSNGVTISVPLAHGAAKLGVLPTPGWLLGIMIAGVFVAVYVGVMVEERRRRRGTALHPVAILLTGGASGWTAGAVVGVAVPLLDVTAALIGGLVIGLIVGRYRAVKAGRGAGTHRETTP